MIATEILKNLAHKELVVTNFDLSCVWLVLQATMRDECLKHAGCVVDFIAPDGKNLRFSTHSVIGCALKSRRREMVFAFGCGNVTGHEIKDHLSLGAPWLCEPKGAILILDPDCQEGGKGRLTLFNCPVKMTAEPETPRVYLNWKSNL